MEKWGFDSLLNVKYHDQLRWDLGLATPNLFDKGTLFRTAANDFHLKNAFRLLVASMNLQLVYKTVE